MVSVAKIMRRPWIVGTGQVHWLLLWKFKRFYSKLREERNTRSPDSPWPRWATLHCSQCPPCLARLERSADKQNINCGINNSGYIKSYNQQHALLLIFKIRELLDLIEDFWSGGIFIKTETELNYLLFRQNEHSRKCAQHLFCKYLFL